MADRYELAVYDEDAVRLTRAILVVCAEAAAIPDRRVRSVIIASALVTAAQVLDGNDMPRETGIMKPGGIASMIQHILAPKQPG